VTGAPRGPGQVAAPARLDDALFLVEDDPQIVDLVSIALRQSGFHANVPVARDGRVAVETLQGMAALPRLVLLDLNLPSLGGLEVLTRLRAHPRTALVPVVILTSSDEDADLREAYRRGANGFVEKPLDYDELVDAVGAVWRYWLVVNRAATRGRWTKGGVTP
jgi:DNA-binding response OmpR family regulator